MGENPSVRRAALLLLVLAACSKKAKDGATCDEVGAKMLELSTGDLEAATKAGRTDPEMHALAEAQLPAMRDSIVRHCKEDGWSPQVRGCFATATDGDAMTLCYQRLPDEQRGRLDSASTSSVE
jgi:hypothetical protein